MPPQVSVDGGIRSLPAFSAGVNAVDRLDQTFELIQAKKFDQAVLLLEELLDGDSNNARAWNNLCAAHNEQGEFGSALADCDHALQLQPDFELARNNRSWAQARRDEVAAALDRKAYDPAIRRDATFYLDCATMLAHIGSYDEAIEAAVHVLSLRAGDTAALNAIGLVHMLKHEPDAARPWFRQALQADPASGLARTNLAWADRKLHDLARIAAPRSAPDRAAPR